jgi:hypothetical protein
MHSLESASHLRARPHPSQAAGNRFLKKLLLSGQSNKKSSSSARSVRDHDVGIILALFHCKGPRPSFFLQTEPCQGLSMTRTPEDAQQKAWGKALIFRSPFYLILMMGRWTVHLELP